MKSGGRGALVVLILSMIGAPVAAHGAGADGSVGQAHRPNDWSVERDPFADLWFHGLAVVGFDGFGAIPLYDPEYGWAVAAHRASLGGPTPLESARGRILAGFAADPSFELLHFVPLYLSGAPDDVALNVLGRLGEHDTVHESHQGERGSLQRTAAALAAAFPSDRHRSVLRDFVALLATERPVLARFDRATIDLSAVRSAWTALTSGPLGAFLADEGMHDGRIIVTPALGLEGRYLDTDEGGVVAVGATSQSDPRAVAGAALRELCYPVVRRVMAPFEHRLGDRARLATASHHVASRCAARLLGAHAPDFLPAYRERFGTSATDAGFLSVPGLGPDAATLMREMDRALMRELHLDQDGSRGDPRPVGR